MKRRKLMYIDFDVRADKRFKELPGFPDYFGWPEGLCFISTKGRHQRILGGYPGKTEGSRLIVLRSEGKTYCRRARSLVNSLTKEL